MKTLDECTLQQQLIFQKRNQIFFILSPSQIVRRFREKYLSQIICRFTIPMQH